MAEVVLINIICKNTFARLLLSNYMVFIHFLPTVEYPLEKFLTLFILTLCCLMYFTGKAKFLLIFVTPFNHDLVGKTCVPDFSHIVKDR